MKKKGSRKTQLTLVERVRRSEQTAIDAGGRRTPTGILPEHAAEALDRLHGAGYAPSKTRVIARALVEADERINANGKKPRRPQ